MEFRRFSQAVRRLSTYKNTWPVDSVRLIRDMERKLEISALRFARSVLMNLDTSTL
jgi:hypothetical protein